MYTRGVGWRDTFNTSDLDMVQQSLQGTYLGLRWLKGLWRVVPS